MDVDLATLTDDELQATFDNICDQLGECDNDDRLAWHDSLMLVTAEMGRRTEAWIAERTTRR